MKFIVLTGAGCSGKSTIVRWLQEDFADQLIIIPEIVEIISKSKLPFPLNRERAKEIKEEYIGMIVAIQNQLESFLRIAYSENMQALVCDRGILDTIAYHPNPMKWFFQQKSSLPAELSRYDIVIQLELCQSIYGKCGYEKPYSLEAALEHQNVLKKYYGYHEDYHFVHVYDNFGEKYKHVVEILNNYIHLGECPVSRLQSRE